MKFNNVITVKDNDGFVVFVGATNSQAYSFLAGLKCAGIATRDYIITEYNSKGEPIK